MDVFEKIEARIDELAAIIEADPENREARQEMTRLLADHTTEIQKVLHG